MKIGWGTAIVIAFGVFIVFILTFVFITFTDKNYEYQLVSDEYYDAELKFQKQIDETKNMKMLEQEVEVTKNGNTLQITIPFENKRDVIFGEIQFYRPSNEKLDFVKKIAGSQNIYRFTDSNLVSGRWNIKVVWQYNQLPKKYFKEISIYF